MNSSLVIPSLAQPPSVAPTIFKTKSQIFISGLKASDLGPIPSILLPCSSLADQPFLLLLQHASGPLHSPGPLPEPLSPGLVGWFPPSFPLARGCPGGTADSATLNHLQPPSFRASAFHVTLQVCSSHENVNGKDLALCSPRLGPAPPGPHIGVLEDGRVTACRPGSVHQRKEEGPPAP